MEFVSKPYASSFFINSGWLKEPKASLMSVDRRDTRMLLSIAYVHHVVHKQRFDIFTKIEVKMQLSNEIIFILIEIFRNSDI